MVIELKKFGKMLMSRPAGKEAFASAKAYVLPKDVPEKEITIDFAGVDVLSPSWADEFISGLKNMYQGYKFSFVHTENQSVKATLETLASLN